jgi:AcrR family transcriptional regulator
MIYNLTKVVDLVIQSSGHTPGTKGTMAASSKSAHRASTGKGTPTLQAERQAERPRDRREPGGQSRADVGASRRGQEPDERTLREERILDTAAALLVRWGYRKTTIDDVAREAGVGKGTIYLHWKDKNELFRAAIWRANQQVGEDIMQRVAADPEGGLVHRLWTHGLLAARANPLVAAIMKGQPDIFQGLISTLDPGIRSQLVGNAQAYVAQLQSAGLIRADIPAPVITFLLTALKVGIINAPDLINQEQVPSMEQLAETLSDLIRRWLEPEQLPGDSDAGKRFLAEWLEKSKDIEEQLQ